MIEKMKKLTFLVTNKEYDSFILCLRDLGVVHVQQLQQGATSQKLQDAIETEQRFKAVMLYLQSAQKTYTSSAQGTAAVDEQSPLQLMQHVEELKQKELDLLHAVDAAQKNVEALEPWGEFDPERLSQLAQVTGKQIHFWRCNMKSFAADWQDRYFAIAVNDVQKRTYFVTFSEEMPDIQAEHIQLPEGALSAYVQERDALRQQLEDLHQELLAIASHQELLAQGLTDARNDIQLNRVRLSDESVAGDMLRLMIGWVRADRTEDLVHYLDEAHIYYEMEDPAFEDDVPVQITNNGFSRLFEPILRMYSLPNYHDIDPSNFFAPFFMLFFGLCMGDGGYGLLILLASIFITLKASPDVRDYGKLGICLGAMTLICGLATGTVFGIDLTQQSWAFLAPVKQYFLSDNGCGPIFGYSPMMVLSVIIGFVQVLIGMVLKACKAWKNYGFAYSIGTFSWVVMLLCAIGTLMVPEGAAFVTYILYALMGVSALGIFLYNNPAAYKNPITGPPLNIGAGLWGTYGMATGLLGDLLSYIRLFALGLTGGILGFVFNSLALDLTAEMSWAVRWIPLCIILLFGHGLTFALSMISAFVHPMRLTFVEFFKNADFSGGGKEYTPFRKIRN